MYEMFKSYSTLFISADTQLTVDQFPEIEIGTNEGLGVLLHYLISYLLTIKLSSIPRLGGDKHLKSSMSGQEIVAICSSHF